MNTLRVAAVFAFLAAAAGAASAGTINVPGDSATIRAAIDLAFDGDTVIVAAGTYPEFLLLDQRNNLTIQAVGVVILDPKSKTKGPPSVVTFSSCQNITFDGFTISKAQANGISVITSLNMSILHCTVEKSRGEGIFSLGSPDLTIADCTVTGTAKNRAGIGVSFGTGNLSARCKVQRCTVSKTGGPGIVVHGDSALVEDCTVTGSKKAGVELDRTGGTHFGQVLRCTITSAGDAGIVVTGHDNKIANNQINGSATYGISVIQDADGATTGDFIHDNTITKTKKKDGINVSAPQCSLETNTISGTHGDGIRVSESGSEIRFNNVTASHGFGVHLSGTAHEVTGNSASGSKKADLWDQSTSSMFTSNTFVKVKL